MFEALEAVAREELAEVKDEMLRLRQDFTKLAEMVRDMNAVQPQKTSEKESAQSSTGSGVSTGVDKRLAALEVEAETFRKRAG